MTAIRVVLPKLRLAELLRSPGGLSVSEAVERAQANLEEIRPACTADLLALLELCEAGCGNIGEKFDDAVLAELYAIAVKGIGAGEVCGLPGLDLALTSFCDLLDHLRTVARYDGEAVGVHVRAWRLLMTSDLPEAGRQQVVDGLLKVSGRYAAEVEGLA